MAGATLFINNEVVHVQYISGIGNKNQHGALDYLFYELITSIFKDYHYFDFGNSNEQNGTQLNQGLHFGKKVLVHELLFITFIVSNATF